MAELTAEVVRDIVKAEISGVVDSLRQEMVNGFDRVVATIQSEMDERKDAQSGLEGRLRNHNERIARLERLNNIR